MKKLLVMSKYIGANNQHQFHFKGFYRGEKIKKIIVEGNAKFIEGEEYLLWVRELAILENELHVELLAWKELLYQ